MKNLVVKQIPRVNPAVVAQLQSAGVATVHEAMGRVGLMRPFMRPLAEGMSAAGPAVTVLAPPGDNWMIHVACELVSRGDVLVVASTSETTDGMVGELLVTLMQAKGLAGLVIDAGCRDVRQVRRLGLPLWCKAISAQGTVKATPGSVNVPVVCAGALVNPGDVVVADDDGVVVVPHASASTVAEVALERCALEERARARMAAGGPALGASPTMLEKLREAGVQWLESAEPPPIGASA